MSVQNLLLAVSFLFPMGAFANASSCLDSEKTQAIFKDFEILKSSERVNIDLCDTRSMAYTLVNGLIFLKELGALDSTRSPLNRNWITGSPYDFFKARVRKIVLDDGSDCTGLSQVWPSERGMKIIHLCSKALDYDKLVLSEAMVHEARHMDPEQHNHAICISGELYGRESCDESYESGGAYAVGVEYLIKVAQTTRLDSNLREQARAMAQKALHERFNTSPVVKTVEVTLRSKDSPKIFR